MKIERIKIKQEARQFYTHYHEKNGYLGIIADEDEEHVYMRTFKADDEGVIYYGFFDRIPKYDILSREVIIDERSKL